MNKTKSRSFSTPFSQKDFFVKTQGKKKKKHKLPFSYNPEGFLWEKRGKNKIGPYFYLGQKKKNWTGRRFQFV